MISDLGVYRLKLAFDFIISSVSALGGIGNGVNMKEDAVEKSMYMGQSKGEHSVLGSVDQRHLIIDESCL
jgi:hypothetical protein